MSDAIAIETILAPLDHLEKNPPISSVETRLRVVASSLNGSDPLRRRAVRSGAISKLRTVKVPGATQLVDAALGREDKADAGKGRLMAFEEPDSWPDPVDGASLLDEIAEIYRRYVVLPGGGAEALALWAAFTYGLDAFDVAPLLVITSPTMQCGKTTTLEIASSLVRRPLPVSNITTAAVFRAMEAYTPTLIADEVDTYLKENVELAGILNSGHTRATAMVLRIEGDSHELRPFSTWGPKMIACIGRLPFPTLVDRSIILNLRRRAPGEPVDRMRRSRLREDLAPIRQRLVRWVADSLPELKEAEPVPPPGLSDRGEDNWRPLLALADAAGGRWPKLARKIAQVLSGGRADEPTAGILLLADVRALYAAEDIFATKDLLAELAKLEERPWPTWNRGKSMTARQLAGLLGPFGVRSGNIRLGASVHKGYALLDFKDSFERYLPPLSSATPLQINPDAQIAFSSDPLHSGVVADGKSSLSTDGEGPVADVADETQRERENDLHEDEVSL
jgi:putative DNA primase/helicase